jgi:subtilisin family serine protease
MREFGLPWSRRTFAIALTLLASLAAVAAGAAVRPRTAGAAGATYVEQAGELSFSGQMIVRPVQAVDWHATGLTPQQVAERRHQAAARLSPGVVQYYAEVDEYVVDVPPGMSENSYADSLLATGEYEYAIPNWICVPVLTPNDPLFSSQWHHQKIQSAKAWDLTTGSSSLTLAVVDTGIDLNHADLKAHLVPGYNSATKLAQVDGGDVSDINGHGTATAGTAAAIGNNGTGVAGVAWNPKIMMVRTTNKSDGTATLADMLWGARWAAEHGAKLVSVSYSGVGAVAVQTTGVYLKSLGSLLIFAAGNSDKDLKSFDWPDVIIVGATNSSDAKAGFSSYGKAVDLFAPGVDIWTTQKGGGYSPVSGTSFSTPMVNGVAAMIWSAHPGLTVNQVQTILLVSCDDLGPPGEDEYWGYGRANVFQAVQLANQAKSPVAPTGLPDVGLVASGVVLELDVLVNDYDLNGDPLHIASVVSPSAHGGTVTISVGTGPGGRDEAVYKSAPGFVGTDTFTYKPGDPGGLSGSATAVTITVQDPATYKPVDAAPLPKPGVRVDYYKVPEWIEQIPDYSALPIDSTEYVAEINFPATVSGFAGSGLLDHFVAAYSGYFHAPKHAIYTFYLLSSDGSKLYLGDSLVVDNDGQHGMFEQSGTIALQEGLHALRLDLLEIAGSAGLILRYSATGIDKAVVPGELLSHSTCPPDVSGDGVIGQEDLGTLLGGFGTCAEDALFAPLADLDGNGCIDQSDLGELLAHYGGACL